MTEKKVIEGLKNLFSEHELDLPWTDSLEILNTAIQVLEEIQQYRKTGFSPEDIKAISSMEIANFNTIQKYRAIGTVEECRVAVEKMEPRKPHYIDSGGIRYTDSYRCPTCEGAFTGTGIAGHCYHCGQAIDWRKEV